MKNIHLYLILSIIFSLLLLFFRIFLTHSVFYSFLVWNLILAAIPLFVTIIIDKSNLVKHNKVLFFAGFIFWILFLPNSPYILTDFVHFKLSSPMPVWFDILLLISFSFNGLILGIISMIKMQKILSPYLSVKKLLILMLAVSILCGFGIYLGRFLRYNSWDMLTSPELIITEVYHRIMYPFKHLKTWGVTFGFGGLVWLTFNVTNEITKLNLNQKPYKNQDAF
ncbi:DUF1361 domain-containing protein [Abyssalbus ytuae]|uniref:DUF1361 domain-containing protein n=1 Tax=Abyssalbus ytuae TaxID=2926907 RepID=A0A9E7CYC7_9FLAO|nr:DUF1361 domain-containing protein [Abyssalbus ytuae]UOB16510.1 DUF1361 domain-containing protein [Abyssalbus ytuae]